jgi:hypothetical protein
LILDVDADMCVYTLICMQVSHAERMLQSTNSPDLGNGQTGADDLNNGAHLLRFVVAPETPSSYTAPTRFSSSTNWFDRSSPESWTMLRRSTSEAAGCGLLAHACCHSAALND